MLPSLSPLSNDHDRVGPLVVRVPPPPRFRALQGTPRNVTVHPGKLADVPTGTAAQRAGLRYEAKVQQQLFIRLGYNYEISPFIHFTDDSGARTCIPDGIYRSSGTRARDRYFIIFEIKSQHMPEAWWQLERLYRPLLEHHSQFKVFCCEICRSYDPAMPFPAKTKLVTDLEAYVRDPFPEFGVLSWKL